MKEYNLGTLIKEVANKKAISPNKLAESIGCTVGNIYKYFRKNNMDIQLLARIGKVLEYDFFYDISKEKGLLDYREDNENVTDNMEKSIDNFTKIVPEVLRKLGKDSLIQFGIRLDDAPDLLTPDFILPAYNITLTYDKPFKDKAQSVYNPNLLKCERVSDGDHIYADYFYSDLFNIRFVDIKISDKTEEEWEETFRFVFDKLKYKMRWNL